MITWRKILCYLSHLAYPALGDIWMLHRVTGEFQLPDATCNGVPCARWTITPRMLETLISDNLRQGKKFVSIGVVLNEVERPLNLRSLLRLDKKWICVTLDDGYLDNYQEAVPIFRKYGIPYCLFVADGFLGTTFKPRSDAPMMMNASQLLELSRDTLCTIGAHTVTHPDMALLTEEEQVQELLMNKYNLEKMLDRKISCCAIPGGLANPHKTVVAKKAGFCAQLDGYGGHVRRGVTLWRIPRIIPIL